ncbi:nuclear transport factor 2 family protein [Streptomyces sp. NPDC003631]|uniref:SnoaL-like domain-containing protein n=1 Tax=Streptomyces lannensis TaxID=766498 RepID=A0ABP7KBA3_9ACTN|nr:nuclear transport factor 2 family protein [Streptomyces sp. WAC07094]
MTDDQLRAIAPDSLPAVVLRYLEAHRVRDTATAIATFTDDATVIDDGATHRGRAAVEQWLDRAASEFTYTTELVGAQQAGDAHYVATQHLEGDFPGGTVDLHYRFTLGSGLIERLVIEP